MPADQTEIRIPAPHPSGSGFLPYWVTDQLEQEVRPLARRGLFGRCRRCRHIIITGLDNSLCAFKAEVDPTPLTAQQEYACYLTGRPTYDALLYGPAIELLHRYPATVEPPEAKPWAVVPAHQCGARFPGFLVPPLTETEHQATPPF